MGFVDWDEVQQALDKGLTLLDYDGDKIVRIEDEGHSDRRRVTFLPRAGGGAESYVSWTADLDKITVKYDGPSQSEVEETLRSIAQVFEPPTVTPPIVSKDGVAQLTLTDDLFNQIKADLERRGLTVVPYKVDDPDDLDTYTVGIGDALWKRVGP